MAIVCRLVQVSPERAAELSTPAGDLAQAIQSATIYSDVNRYWGGIQSLLARHGPGSLAGR